MGSESIAHEAVYSFCDREGSLCKNIVKPLQPVDGWCHQVSVNCLYRWIKALFLTVTTCAILEVSPF